MPLQQLHIRQRPLYPLLALELHEEHTERLDGRPLRRRECNGVCVLGLRTERVAIQPSLKLSHSKTFESTAARFHGSFESAPISAMRRADSRGSTLLSVMIFAFVLAD